MTVEEFFELDVGLEFALGFAVGVADEIADERSLAAHETTLSHDESNSGWMILFLRLDEFGTAPVQCQPNPWRRSLRWFMRLPNTKVIPPGQARALEMGGPTS